jgi:acylphosphatase
MTEATIRRHVRVRGAVQGVFFRETTRRKATEAGVAGWVANQPDGSVEAVFEGSPDAVELMLDFVREGPTAADVASVDVDEQPPEGLAGFDVR